MSDEVAEKLIRSNVALTDAFNRNTEAILTGTSEFVDAKQACAILGYTDVKSLKNLRKDLENGLLFKEESSRKIIIKRSKVLELKESRKKAI